MIRMHHLVVDHFVGQCPHCVSPSSGQKQTDTFAIPENLTLKQETPQPSQSLSDIVWAKDNHRAEIDVHSLLKSERNHGFTPSETLWNREAISHIFKEGQLSTSYDQYLDTESGFSKTLKNLEQFGLAFITQVPRQEKAIELIGERIGPLRHTFYGRTWDVKDKPNAENVAYTATELGLHMDLL